MSSSPTPVRTPFVLLVEDSPADVYIVRESLKKHMKDVELQVLNDGEKAFALIEATEADDAAPTPAILILDLNLPKRSGQEILRRVRQSSRFGRIPVVIFTSSDSPLDRAETTRLGATAYFRKPADLEEFMCIGKVVQSVLTAHI
ncbi:MAG TPA: response regulator [Bryobacteraceae bacterium]|jgi:CheY-like chemotaxis protein|nr:response regulator [Bryobacteraceae bacterium]